MIGSTLFDLGDLPRTTATPQRRVPTEDLPFFGVILDRYYSTACRPTAPSTLF